MRIKYGSVSDVARRLKVRPRVVSDLIYHHAAEFDFPIVGGNRLVPMDQLERIKTALDTIHSKPATNKAG